MCILNSNRWIFISVVVLLIDHNEQLQLHQLEIVEYLYWTTGVKSVLLQLGVKMLNMDVVISAFLAVHSSVHFFFLLAGSKMVRELRIRRYESLSCRFLKKCVLSAVSVDFSVQCGRNTQRAHLTKPLIFLMGVRTQVVEDQDCFSFTHCRVHYAVAHNHLAIVSLPSCLRDKSPG